MKRGSLAVAAVTNPTLISVLGDIIKGQFHGQCGYGLIS